MEINKSKKYNNKKILIVLIAIGIIAILVSTYIQHLKPYAAELSERDRDPERIEKLSLIDSALTKLKDANQDISLGEQNRVYISAPSFSANCSGLNLPSLPENWEYRCRPETDFQKIDGSGWLPVDFTKLPKDKDNVIPNLFRDLPIDPVNNADSGYYYSYVVDENNDWVLTSLLESDKYLKETALKDGGTDPAKIEIGSNLQLWAKASGLVGYWSFDEGQGEIAKDLSGNGNDGALINEPEWVDGKVGKALSFDGVDDYVDYGNDEILNNENAFTVEVWIKTSEDISERGIITKSNGFAGITAHGWSLRIRQGKFAFAVRKKDNTGYFDLFKGTNIEDGKWHHIVGVFDTNTMKKYLDGNLEQEVTTGQSYLITRNNCRIGMLNSKYFNGKIDEIKIYNRTLNTKEIQATYNATK